MGGRVRRSRGGGHSWTEGEEILLCRLRLTGVPVAELAQMLTRLLGDEVTKNAVSARLTTRGVRLQEPASWIEEEHVLFRCVAEGTLALEDAFEESERRGNLPDRLRRWRRGQFDGRYEGWRWRRAHLSEVPEDPGQWGAYRERLLREWGDPAGSPPWIGDEEFRAAVAERWPHEPTSRLRLRYEGWLAARGR